MTIVLPAGQLQEQFVYVSVRDPRARPLFDELAHEYHSRYSDVIDPEALRQEMVRYPDAAFAPPHGAFVLLLRDGVAVAGGAFMRHADAGTAEFKRIWASRHCRRQGLARACLTSWRRRPRGRVIRACFSAQDRVNPRRSRCIEAVAIRCSARTISARTRHQAITSKRR